MTRHGSLLKALEKCEEPKSTSFQRKKCVKSVVDGWLHSVPTRTPYHHEVPSSRKEPDLLTLVVNPGEQVLVEKRKGSEPTLKHEWEAFEKYRASINPAGEGLAGEFRQRDYEREGILYTNYRLKTIPSIINKLRREHLQTIRDVAGIQVVHEDYSDLLATRAFVRKEYPNAYEEDFYEMPKPGNLAYRAVHYDVCVEGEPEVSQGEVVACSTGTPLELQLKTKRQKELHKEWHLRYKEGEKKPRGAMAQMRRAHARDVAESKRGRFYFKQTATSIPVSIGQLTPTESISKPKRDRARKNMLKVGTRLGKPRKPLTVKQVGRNQFEIQDGNQTFHAAKQMGLRELEVEVLAD
tara:strand:+ start:1337 stop:2392 length:1056 start_codon:yes stop_codon:yes gene_type:complete